MHFLHRLKVSQLTTCAMCSDCVLASDDNCLTEGLLNLVISLLLITLFLFLCPKKCGHMPFLTFYETVCIWAVGFMLIIWRRNVTMPRRQVELYSRAHTFVVNPWLHEYIVFTCPSALCSCIWIVTTGKLTTKWYYVLRHDCTHITITTLANVLYLWTSGFK